MFGQDQRTHSTLYYCLPHRKHVYTAWPVDQTDCHPISGLQFGCRRKDKVTSHSSHSASSIFLTSTASTPLLFRDYVCVCVCVCVCECIPTPSGTLIKLRGAVGWWWMLPIWRRTFIPSDRNSRQSVGVFVVRALWTQTVFKIAAASQHWLGSIKRCYWAHDRIPQWLI